MFHVQVLETQYQNLYSGLYLANHGTPQDAALSAVRSGPVPGLKVVQAMSLQNGNLAVVSPPPQIMSKDNFLKTVPKGKYICCITKLQDLSSKKMVIEGEMELSHEIPAAIKQGNDESEA